ncbi:MAG: DNA-binding protein [Candidatus Ryanbacteria bacterium CG10_big_fil_rev_8_21_14_0_10_43_42]|uniref:DNA-binding protein n=1 Tax=Candidatus Ryanbacteria bacterium CG10_big_fil_rev_8_21_14_0_10_43_42 TaxID=1974864 RepID=A0A2M8KWF4_9BACT|nr:MAG: DNA-binding protein [Candidatus Ryanbacteria bacterium CG10_big_fil_rev_8_21_14_0_10_43_42]
MKKQQDNFKDLPLILSLRQVSEILSVHPNTLRNWDNRGILRAIRYGTRGDRRYRKVDIEHFLK